MKRPSRSDLDRLNNAAHRFYAAISDREPMMQTTIAPKRKASMRGASGVPLEHEEQVAVIDFWRHYSKTIGCDWRQLVAVPNGQILFRYANNPHAVLAYLHKEGMRDGMMDLVLFHARPGDWGAYGWNGLCIEMKRTVGGTVSDDQAEMARILSKAGYRCEIARGADAAIKIIKEYCEGKDAAS